MIITDGSFLSHNINPRWWYSYHAHTIIGIATLLRKVLYGSQTETIFDSVIGTYIIALKR